jgi:hypothetical protein
MQNLIKNLLLGFCVILCVATVTYNQPVWAETTQVCVDLKDELGRPLKDKSGKVQQRCRTMKKHEKLEGTKVPEKK